MMSEERHKRKLAATAKWRAANKEHLKAWRAAHRDKARTATNEWRGTNREWSRQLSRKAATKVYARNRTIINDAKDKPCMDCGIKYPIHVMDFDHARDVKTAAVSRMTSLAVETVLKEIAKCDVVCSNCHRERTHRRRNS
jgi:hypothetical protein